MQVWLRQRASTPPGNVLTDARWTIPAPFCSGEFSCSSDLRGEQRLNQPVEGVLFCFDGRLQS